MVPMDVGLQNMGSDFWAGLCLAMFLSRTFSLSSILHPERVPASLLPTV